jgi:hypothetical protein
MAILVNEARLSLVWNKVFLKDTNLPHFADPDQYKDAFGRAHNTEEPWMLPWLTGRKQHFWQYYLQPVEPSNFEKVSAVNARAYFVPLRLPACARAIARDGTVATIEGFCFPYSVGIVATIHVCPPEPLSLLQMVDAAVAARNADFQLVWKDKTLATHGALQSLADKIVERVHALALADPVAIGKPLPFPLTVATVIDASMQMSSPPAAPVAAVAPPPPGALPETTPANSSAASGTVISGSGDTSEDRSLGRALNALCLLQPGWKDRNFEGGLPDFVDPALPQLLAIERGRAIWLPHRFSAFEVKGRKTALGCYHRNLTLATLQTAALTALVGRADEVLADAKGKLLSLLPNEVSGAIDLLRKLKAGDYSTYRSWSLKHQISFHDERIARVSEKLGL